MQAGHKIALFALLCVQCKICTLDRVLAFGEPAIDCLTDRLHSHHEEEDVFIRPRSGLYSSLSVLYGSETC